MAEDLQTAYDWKEWRRMPVTRSKEPFHIHSRNLSLMSAMVLVWLVLLAGCRSHGDKIRVVIINEPLNHVDDRLFGHFMERASWGEPGYDAARVGDTGQLDPRVVELLEKWHVPVIRWPGGGDIRHIDWRDMVDNVPNRKGPRPVFNIRDDHPPLTNRFGLDEFLQLCEKLDADALLPVNFGIALRKDKPLKEAALLAAGMVAYCNTPVGAKLPEGMPDWPAVRARNGHPEPYGVRYFQIGNEIWIYARKAFEKIGMGQGKSTTSQRKAWYLKCFNAYADAMKSVDPHIELITELNHVGHKLDPNLNERIREDRSLAKADWFVRHTYAPWAIRKVTRQGREISPASLTDEQIWNAWVTTPKIDPSTGQAILGWESEFRRRGWRVAVTEWNWNGWWSVPKERRPAFNSDLAKGVGAAGWLHAFMRLGDEIRLACQSMTVGSTWGITGIRVAPSGQFNPYPLPTGQVTGLYSRYHGSVRLRLEHANVPSYSQPFRMSGIAPAQKVLALDLVATADGDNVYLHLINRSFGRDLPVTVDLNCFEDLTGTATLHTLTGRVRNNPVEDESRQVADVKDTPLSFTGNFLEVTIPRRSVSVLVIPRKAND